MARTVEILVKRLRITEKVERVGVPWLQPDDGLEVWDRVRESMTGELSRGQCPIEVRIGGRQTGESLQARGLCAGIAGSNGSKDAQLGALAPLIDWTSRMAGFWQSRFDDLEDLLKRMDQ